MDLSVGRVGGRAERMVALEGRLAAVHRGDDKPKDAAESLGFADLAYNARRFGPSARWYAEAFQAVPKLAEDMNMLNRYCAASAAALASAGKAGDAQPQIESAKVVGRMQAVDWLKADLAYWTKQAETGTQEAKGLVSQTLQAGKPTRAWPPFAMSRRCAGCPTWSRTHAGSGPRSRPL